MYYVIVDEKSLTVHFATKRKAEAEIFLREKHLEGIDLAAEEILHYQYQYRDYEELDALLDTSKKKREFKLLAGAFGAYDYRLYKIKDSDRSEIPLRDTEGYEFTIKKQDILKNLAKNI